MANSVLGQFRGKACDTNVFNNNDMHLGTEVFKKLIASEDYKRAMKNRHYIGFLGHPENPDCQDYEHACIVMTDQKLLNNGEVEGAFDLIDTPVGRVVKAFIDAGVKFGISIRGVGEVDGQGEVDPDEFIFRGYDLVTFPAYDDCIPEFKAIAASTDVNKKAQYKKICAAIDTNLKDITSSQALEVIKEQLPESDPEYAKVQARIDEINSSTDTEIIASVNEQKIEAMTQLYLTAAEKVRNLEVELATCKSHNREISVECNSLKHKQSKLDKIVADQIVTANRKTQKALRQADTSAKRLKAVKASLTAVKANLAETEDKLAESEKNLKQTVVANTKLREKIDAFTVQKRDDRESINASKNLNLKYQRKIENSSKLLSERDDEIAKLTDRVNETVTASSALERENKKLTAKVEAAEDLIYAYQQAYANLYANALGVHLTGLPVTASTSVEELKQMITAGTSTANIAARPSYNTDLISDEDEEDEEGEYIHGDDDDFDDTQYGADLATM